MDVSPDDCTGHSADPIHVLVVDDEVIAAMALERLLTRHRFKVSIAANGEQALRLYGEHDVDAVITDFRMPKMNGGELVKNLRSLASNLPIAVMTGYAPEIPNLDITRPVPVMHKPLDVSEVLSMLKAWFPNGPARTPIP